MTNDEIENLTTDILRYFGAEAKGARSVVRTFIRNADSSSRRGQQTPADDNMLIEARSLVSSKDYRPIVAIDWNDKHGQLSPGEAREFAERVRRTADAAESDAFVFEFMTKEIGTDPAHASQVMHLFREFREERARKDFDLRPEPKPAE